MIAPTVSVVIPTYRHRDYVLETLRSVFAQSFTDYEVIVVNDGSDDGTEEVLRPLATASRIAYFEQSNSGQAAARNHGLARARGEFIAFLDDDDLWPEDKLQWQTDVLRAQTNIGIVGGNVAEVGCENPWLPQRTAICEPSLDDLYRGLTMTSPGQSLIRTQLLREYGGFDERLAGADDYDMWLRLARVTKIEMHDRVALYYRRHPNQASRDMGKMMHMCLAAIEKNLFFSEPADRARQRRLGYRFAYNYAGTSVVTQTRRFIEEMNFREAMQRAWLLKPIAGAAIRDLKLAVKVTRDLIPKRFCLSR